MTKTIKALCVLVGIFCSLNSFLPGQHNKKVSAQAKEIRGVWAATVFSLDYPSSPSTSEAQLRKQADDLLNNVQGMGYNTLFFQVRPSGDAFYKSEIFPWSKYLTGTQGLAPDDNFDPLEYITDEAHKRGISLHAWINPYRVTASQNDVLCENSIPEKYPHLVVKHTDGKLYLNPGEPDTNKLVVDGILEIVKNYNIDGIHLDDYFYPDSSFPDSETFTRYGGNFSDIGDWRRSNTENLIRSINSALKSASPGIVFSVSPCGIWANKESHPEGSDTKGIQSYFDYYADTRLWVKENLIDWIIPQVYWNIGHSAADFETVVKWWDSQVAGTNVHLCVGQGIYKISDETNSASVWFSQKGIQEATRQIQLIHNTPSATGYVHYRLGSITKAPGLIDFARQINTGEVPVFTDLGPYPWAKDAILALNKKGIINGMGDGTFGASLNINRADFTVMLVRMLGKDAPVTDNFTDVTPDKYFFHEIGVAKALGITTGRDGKIFDPYGNITREDMATLAFRLMESEKKLNNDETNSSPAIFSDADQISAYAKDAVDTMTSMGILNGYETGEFKPKAFATRVETAVFLNKLSEKF